MATTVASSIAGPMPCISTSASPATVRQGVINFPLAKAPSLPVIPLAASLRPKLSKASCASAALLQKTWMTHCQVTLKSSDLTASLDDPDEELKRAAAAEKMGARVRVKVPLKVFHVPRVPEVDLIGMEGQLKQFVGFWKGKRLSANLPFKVEFVTMVEGRGPVKFFAHLKEDEFEYIDTS